MGKYFIERTICPACHSKTNDRLVEIDYSNPEIVSYLKDFYDYQGGVEIEYLDGESFVLNRCQTCKLVFQQSIPNDFLMKKLYGEWIDPKIGYQFHIKQRTQNYYDYKAHELSSLAHYNDWFPSETKVFDFGLGWSEWAGIAKSFGYQVFGTEINEDQINYAEKIGIKTLLWEDIPNFEFDFIHTEQVLEHVADPLLIIKYLAKTLKPKGIIKISVPNGWDIDRRLKLMDWKAPKLSKYSLNPVAPLEHINCFSHDSIVNMASLANLKIINIYPKFRLDKSILKLTVEDILRPPFHWFNKVFRGKQPTTLYFQKN